MPTDPASLVVHLSVIDRTGRGFAKAIYWLKVLRIRMNRTRPHSARISAMHSAYHRKTKGRRP